MTLQRVRNKKIRKINNFLLMSWRSLTKLAGSGSGSIRQKYGSADPDPHQISRIRTTLIFYNIHSLTCSPSISGVSGPSPSPPSSSPPSSRSPPPPWDGWWGVWCCWWWLWWEGGLNASASPPTDSGVPAMFSVEEMAATCPRVGKNPFFLKK